MKFNGRTQRSRSERWIVDNEKRVAAWYAEHYPDLEVPASEVVHLVRWPSGVHPNETPEAVEVVDDVAGVGGQGAGVPG